MGTSNRWIVWASRSRTAWAAAPPYPRAALFTHVYILDFSARGMPSPKKPSPDALWLGHARAGGRDPASARYFHTRAAVADDLGPRLERALDAGERVLLGVDFGLGYPAGFADAAVLPGDGPGCPAWRRTWACLRDSVEDGPDNANNRFAVADEQAAPARRRIIEHRVKSAHELWKLFTTGSVGGQTLLGIAWLARLLERPGLTDRHAVWPFSDGFVAPDGMLGRCGLTVAEVYPRLSDDAAGTEALTHAIRDAAQVRTLAGMLAARAVDGRLTAWFGEPEGLSAVDRDRCVAEEGWILGDRLV